MIEARILKNVIAFMDRAAIAGLQTQENVDLYVEARAAVGRVLKASAAMSELPVPSSAQTYEPIILPREHGGSVENRG